MFPYVPYLYPLMLLLCKQKIVFPLPSVSGEKDTALRIFPVLLINAVCRQPGWSLSYLVPFTTIPRYFSSAFVLYLLSPALTSTPLVFHFSFSVWWINKNLQKCTNKCNSTSLFFPLPFQHCLLPNVRCCWKALGRTLRVSHKCHVRLTPAWSPHWQICGWRCVGGPTPAFWVWIHAQLLWDAPAVKMWL